MLRGRKATLEVIFFQTSEKKKKKITDVKFTDDIG